MKTESAMPTQNLRGPDNLPFSPQRDLAYLYPEACREAFGLLDKVNWPEYFQDWLDATDLTEYDLAAGVNSFCDAHELFVGDPTVTNPGEAFARAGFLDIPHPVRVLIFEVLGEVLMGGFFVAIRDVTIRGSIPPQSRSLADMTAAGRVLSLRLRGRWVSPVTMLSLNLSGDTPEPFRVAQDLTVAQEQILAYGSRLSAARDKLDEAVCQISRLTTQCNTFESCWETARPAAEFLDRLQQQPWYSRLFSILRLWWRNGIPDEDRGHACRVEPHGN